jgi:hypothetical protein
LFAALSQILMNGFLAVHGLRTADSRYTTSVAFDAGNRGTHWPVVDIATEGWGVLLLRGHT